MDQIIAAFPERWREPAQLLLAPIRWIPRTQDMLIDFFLRSPSGWVAAGKIVFLLFPVLLCLAALWSTQLSLYTLPFRSGRIRFISTMLLAWWDGARAVWLYWVGLVRCAGIIVGWLVSLANFLVRMLFDAVRQVAMMPFTITGRMTQTYFQPGVPWVAFVMLVFWCVLEAAIFTYTLLPMMSEMLADLAGAQETARYTAPILYLVLLMLIMGSFACVQALMDAIKKREMKHIVQIVVVEIAVMGFEVMFLYREMVDALTPWIAQQTGAKVGIVFTLSLAAFGWFGVRGMTWFLFGQYGTPPLLSFISRNPIEMGNGRHAPAAAHATVAWWRAPIEEFKREIEWLHSKSDQLVEYLALPVLHVVAAAVNFGMVMVTSKPVFHLPFKTLSEITETRELLNGFHLHPKQVRQ